MTPRVILPPPFPETLADRLLALNNAHAKELSWSSPAQFAALLEAASHVRAEAEGLGLIVAFDHCCTYDNGNFHWFKERYGRFYYIDRVAVDSAARGSGLARAFYAELAGRARQEGIERLVCEVNHVPPNPASDRFHEGLGFNPVGERELAGTGKTVRYWSSELI